MKKTGKRLILAATLLTAPVIGTTPAQARVPNYVKTWCYIQAYYLTNPWQADGEYQQCMAQAHKDWD